MVPIYPLIVNKNLEFNSILKFFVIENSVFYRDEQQEFEALEPPTPRIFAIHLYKNTNRNFSMVDAGENYKLQCNVTN